MESADSLKDVLTEARCEVGIPPETPGVSSLGSELTVLVGLARVGLAANSLKSGCPMQHVHSSISVFQSIKAKLRPFR